MATSRWAMLVMGGLALCACSSHTPPPDQAATAKDPSTYPRCPANSHTCVNLSDGINPAEFTASDYPAVGLPLAWKDHKATAFGLNGANTYLDDIVVGPAGRIYAVGGPGLQVVTNDGTSNNWHVAQHSPFANALRSIGLVDAKRAFTVGDEADILRTLDAGGHWDAFNRTFQSYTDPQRQDLLLGGDDRGVAYGVAFADAEHGVIVGQAGVQHTVEAGILRTSDGGQQWQRVALPASLGAVALQKVAFVDGRKGWAVGSGGTVLRTDDAGEHWSAVPLGDTDVHLMTLSFSGAAHGCMGGNYKVWCTWDGGQQWQPATIELPHDIDNDVDVGITALRLDDAGHGWFVTRNGLIFTSTDEGRHWKLWMNVVDAAHDKLQGVELWGLALDHNHAWVVGVGSFNVPEQAGVSLNNSPLILSWSW